MPQENSNDTSVDKDIAALSDKALQLYREGHLQQAQDACLRILRKQQRPDAILILGKIAHEQREFKLAVERYQQFLGLMPNHKGTHFHLGIVLEELGRTDRAIEHFKKSIGTTADNAAVHSHLADACSKRKRWVESIEAYQQVLAIQAEDVITMLKLGNVFYAAQRWPESIPLYERALVLQPDNAKAYRQLGTAQQKMGRTKKAIDCFERALSLRPNYVGARIDLALVLRQSGRAKEGLVQLEQAINLGPDHVDAHINLALTLRQLGQTQAAIERLEQFLDTVPGCGEAYYHISLMKPGQELILAVEKLISDPKLPNIDAIYCHFALGNLFNGSKAFDQAFSHFLKANTRQRETYAYDPKENGQVFDRTAKVYSKRFFQRKDKIGSASQLPVFIVGMPRSGTTLVEQILSSHALVHGAGELDALPGVNLAIAQELEDANPRPELTTISNNKIVEKYSAQYLRELTLHCSTATRIIDKQPANFSRIGLIKTLFPDARIIHCHRNPLDNCISLFFHCFMALTCSFELTELGQYYLQYQRLMSHWQNLFPGEIFDLQYEELVTDQERVSRQLIDYLDLEWDDNCMDFHANERPVMSPSNMQVRQPMYKTSINRWRHYEKHLQPLINVLQQAHV